MLTAYPEDGHAIVGINVIATDPIHKATIIPRGRALGMVLQLPESDKLSMSLEQMTSRLAIMMGGRVAEELVFGREKVTSGAASDIEQATRLARMMVTRWGLSEELGTVSYGENQDEVFLGMSVSRTQNASEATVQKIDSEIRRLVEEGYNQATKILTEKRADLEALAKGLLEYETLTGDEIIDLLKGKKPNRESVLEPTTPRTSAVPPAGKPRPRPDPDPGLEPQPELGIVDIFFALFGHTPLWMKLLLIVRNTIAGLFGLEVPTVGEIMKPEVRCAYSVSEKIGPWPIFHIADNEIVAGRNNKHMDFRLSVLKAMDGDAMSVVVSTICTVHNVFGKIYLFLIVPFRRHGVRSLISNAVVAKRL